MLSDVLERLSLVLRGVNQPKNLPAFGYVAQRTSNLSNGKDFTLSRCSCVNLPGKGRLSSIWNFMSFSKNFSKFIAMLTRAGCLPLSHTNGDVLKSSYLVRSWTDKSGGHLLSGLFASSACCDIFVKSANRKRYRWFPNYRADKRGGLYFILIWKNPKKINKQNKKTPSKAEERMTLKIFRISSLLGDATFLFRISLRAQLAQRTYSLVGQHIEFVPHWNNFSNLQQFPSEQIGPVTDQKVENWRNWVWDLVACFRNEPSDVCDPSFPLEISSRQSLRFSWGVHWTFHSCLRKRAPESFLWNGWRRTNLEHW